jgi:hypothetical protein
MINGAHPETDGDTKPCPRCRGSLIFRPGHPILTVGAALQLSGYEVGNRIRYERGWFCETPACGYRELIVGQGVETTVE